MSSVKNSRNLLRSYYQIFSLFIVCTVVVGSWCKIPDITWNVPSKTGQPLTPRERADLIMQRLQDPGKWDRSAYVPLPDDFDSSPDPAKNHTAHEYIHNLLQMCGPDLLAATHHYEQQSFDTTPHPALERGVAQMQEYVQRQQAVIITKEINTIKRYPEQLTAVQLQLQELRDMWFFQRTEEQNHRIEMLELEEIRLPEIMNQERQELVEHRNNMQVAQAELNHWESVLAYGKACRERYAAEQKFKGDRVTFYEEILTSKNSGTPADFGELVSFISAEDATSIEAHFLHEGLARTQQRVDAIDAINQSSRYELCEKRYEIPTDLQKVAPDFYESVQSGNITADAFQHQLYHENFELVANVTTALHGPQTQEIETCLVIAQQFAGKALGANYQGDIVGAVDYTDKAHFWHNSAEYIVQKTARVSFGFAKGVVKGLIDLAKSPIYTFNTAVKLLGCLKNAVLHPVTSFQTCNEKIHTVCHKIADPEQREKLYCAARVFIQYCHNLPLENQVETLIEHGLPLFVPASKIASFAKMLQSSDKVQKGVRKAVDGLQKLQRTVHKSIEKAKITVDALAKQRVVFNTVRLMQQQAKQAQKLEQAAHGRLSPYFHMNPSELIHLVHKFDHVLDLADVAKNIPGIQSMPLYFDYLHILMGEINVCNKGQVFMTGCHTLRDAMVKSGEFIFEKIDKFKVPPGFEVFNFGVKGFDSDLKVFFPKDWSHGKIMSKIMESIKNGTAARLNNGTIEVLGNIVEGIEICSVINPRTGQIISAFPSIFPRKK